MRGECGGSAAGVNTSIPGSGRPRCVGAMRRLMAPEEECDEFQQDLHCSITGSVATCRRDDIVNA